MLCPSYEHMSTRADKTSVGVASECDVVIVDEEAVAAASASLPGDLRVKALCDIFSALGDPTRLRILMALASQPLCVCDLAAVAQVSQSAASHQLRSLRDLDLVKFERQGKRAVYSLADDHVVALLAQGREHADERF